MTIMLIFFGLLFGVIGVTVERRERRLRKRGRRVLAVIEERVFKPGERLPSSVMVRYALRDGREWSTSMVLDTADAQVEVGDSLEIIYNPADVNEVCTVASVSGRPKLFGERIFLVLSALSITVGISIAFFEW